ncbi:MAG: MBL fold metallo-hydrolase [Candidatus Hodarchaeota archaeon]
MEKILDHIYSINPCTDVLFDSSKYLIDTRSAEGLILIDPGLYIKFLKEIEEEGFSIEDINHCLITHGHLDHFGACYKLKELNENIKFYAHELEAISIEQKLSSIEIQESYPGYDYSPIKLTKKIKGVNEILTIGDYRFECIHTPGHSPGAVAYFLETIENKILFGGDIAGSSLMIYGGNYNEYSNSMKKLEGLNADILCDGHSGPIKPAKKVSEYINGYLELNELFHLTIEEEVADIKIWNELVLKLYELKEYDFALDLCNYVLEIEPRNDDANRLLQKIKEHNPPIINYIKPLLKKISLIKKGV